VKSRGVEVDGYRVGWGWLPRFFGQVNNLLPWLIRGHQPDGQRVARMRYMESIIRDARFLLTRPIGQWIHRPWQAESCHLNRAERAFTRRGAERRILAKLRKVNR